jgi:hypothetical protein
MNKRFLLLLALFSTCASATTLNPIQLLNPAGSTSGQAIVSTGASTAPAWASVTAGGLVAQASNTVVANVTAASASPTAVALPSCSTTNSALKYTTSTGFSCGTTFALTSGTLAQFSATTSAQLAGIISDETGSGSAVFGTSPTIASPSISGATITSSSYAGSVSATTLSASSTITPSQTAGIVGTTTNNNANAGSVGEYICAQVTNGGSPTGCATNTNTPVSLTSGTASNVTSISLTAGDWDVSGNCAFVPTSTTNIGSVACSISTVSATNGRYSQIPGLPVGNTAPTGITAPLNRVSIAATTTVYLVSFGTFSASTLSSFGFIAARRIR